jgi:hypothetical protein
MLKRTKLGLLQAFAIQYQGILLSSSAFDAGHRGEAARIANAIFVLLGPMMRNHKSIVGQLGASETVRMFSTASRDGPHGSALIAVEAVPYAAEDAGKSGYIIYATPFGHEPLMAGRQLTLTEWWNEGVLGGVDAPHILTRLDVIRIMRDQDGGAHLDDHIKDGTYLAALLKGVGFQYKPRADSDKIIPVEGAIEATVRQIAYEVLYSLKSLSITASITLSHAASGDQPLFSRFFEEVPPVGRNVDSDPTKDIESSTERSSSHPS